MKYELAKKLNGAGFPQGDELVCKCYFLSDGEKGSAKSVFDCKTERVYVPKLEELIYECGANINFNLSDNWSDIDFLGWEAYGDGHTGYGYTPNEAVANLWLAINKKQYAKQKTKISKN